MREIGMLWVMLNIIFINLIIIYLYPNTFLTMLSIQYHINITICQLLLFIKNICFIVIILLVFFFLQQPVLTKSWLNSAHLCFNGFSFISFNFFFSFVSHLYKKWEKGLPIRYKETFNRVAVFSIKKNKEFLLSFVISFLSSNLS